MKAALGTVKAHRRLHDRRVARHHRRVPAERVLPVARGLHGGARRGDARRVRGDRRAGIMLQLDCPDLAMGRHSRFKHLDEARVPAPREHPGGRAEPRAARTCRPTGCGCTSAGATTKARTRTTSPLTKMLPLLLRAKPQALLIEGANPRHEHEWDGLDDAQAARRQGPGPRRHRYQHELRRASRAGRAAHRALRERRRPRAGDRRHGLRPGHVCRLRPGPSRHRLGQAAVAVSRRGAGLEPPLKYAAPPPV